MEKYSYKAMDTSGKVIKGKLIASGPEELKSLVQKNGLYCISYAVDQDLSKAQKRMPNKSLVTLCNQLASMLKAGLSIANALEMLYGRLEDPVSKKALGVMYESVQKGNSMSDAIWDMGETFPYIMYNMVKSGEMSGELDSTLRKLAAHFESEQKLNNQIKGAMSYPMMLLGIGVVVIIVLITFVMPAMAGSMGDAMSPQAIALMAFGDWLKANIILCVLILVGAFIGIKTVLKSGPVRVAWDNMKIKLPKFGKLVKMIYTARFARGLATLYDNGIELIEALSMSSKLIGNAQVANVLNDSVEKIKKGETISAALSGINVFDPLLISMIYVGEESGVLGEILNQTADYFDEESSYAIGKIVGMINPIMLLVLVGSIGYVLVICLAPLLSLYQTPTEE